ncbi:hypothetical protein GTQ99_13900, partial [Kineococcus sp. T13]|uniref:ATP-binding protein n=1 Tax=Kineococcus vitellinus TaxID=2696565 RepID=UPI001412CA29
MTRDGAQRLLALVLALGVLSVGPTVVTGLVSDPGQLPAAWAAATTCGYLLAVVGLVVQAVRLTGRRWPAWAVVVLGDVVLASYPLVARSSAVDVPWVLGLSPVTVGAGAVAGSGLGAALALAVLHLVLRALVQLSGTWVVPPERAAFDALGLLVIATAASVAVQSVRLAASSVERARERAQAAASAAAAVRAVEQEHSRWDALVHDDVLASLAQTTQARTAADRRAARAAAATALQRVERGAARGTGPVQPPDAELADVLAELVETVRALHPDALVQVPPATGARLDPEAADALVAAAAEAVRNAVRHGSPAGAPPPAVRVRVRTDTRRGRLRVEVRDDGVGFVPRRPSARLGLAVSVRRRADVVGGTALVRSAPGVGTVVLLGVPLRP